VLTENPYYFGNCPRNHQLGQNKHRQQEDDN